MSRDRYGIKFTRATAKRLFDAGRFVEQQPRNQVAPASGPVDFGGSMMLHVTTALSPMSGATPSQGGRGKIQQLSAGVYSDLSTAVYPIVNDTEKTVAIGSYVLCIPGPGGLMHMILVDKCSNLS